jgi:SET domain-containing protein
MLICQKGYVAKAGKKGRGIFALRNVKKGEIIEISPYIEIPSKEYNTMTRTILNDYRFEVRGNKCAIGLGYASLYNHSPDPNAEASIQPKRKTITIKAIHSIKKGEEVTLDYGYEI